MGMETAQEPPKETFRGLHWAGKIAGYDMNQAINGVNTHKGVLFSIGMLCGVLGRLPREKRRNVKVVLGECVVTTEGTIEHDFREATEENAGTTGEKLYVKYGITEIRGQAEKGSPVAMEAGLSTLEKGLEKGLSLEQTGCAALLALMVPAVNINLIIRSNRETQFQMTEEVREILKRSPYPEEDMLEILDRAFISKNFSPGGSADLLALTYFLYFLREQQITGFMILRIYSNDRRGTKQVKALLEKEGITLDKNLNYTCCLYDDDYNSVATGNCFGNTLRCFAVSKDHQGEGLLSQVVSHPIQIQFGRRNYHLFLYTKCGPAEFFGDLGLYEIARADNCAVFMESHRTGFRDHLKKLEEPVFEDKKAATTVMNAGPFTLGHQYLVEKAAEENDIVHLFAVSKNASLVPSTVWKKLVQEGVACLPNTVVHESGSYIISSATLPSYSLKDEETVVEGHTRLDLAVFFQITRELQICRRYVGEGPFNQMTKIYNQIMGEELEKKDINCVVVPREERGGAIISTSTMRQHAEDIQ